MYCRIFIITCLSFWMSSSLAADRPLTLDEMRDVFLKAEYAAKKPKRRQYRMLYEQLDGYPLQPYAELIYLKKRAYLSYEPQVTQFLDYYEGTPMDEPLRKQWLQYLSEKNDKQRFLRDFKSFGKAGLKCQQLRYQLEDKKNEPAVFKQVEALWTVGHSQPKTCDPLFKLWMDKGYLTEQMVLKRIQLAADGGKHTLIPYLKKKLSPKNQYLADLWRKTRISPSFISKQQRFPRKSDIERDIVLYGIKRLIWRKKKLALRIWPSLVKKYQLTNEEQGKVAYSFAIRLAAAHDKSAREWLEKVPSSLIDSKIVQWQIADGLRAGDWPQVLSLLQGLPQDVKQKEAWQYWLARALVETGKPDDAKPLFEQLAKKRHYYGFLAAGILNKPISLEDNPLQFDDGQTQPVMENPGMARALEFMHFDRKVSARREWRHLLYGLSDEEKLIAAKLAHTNGWVDRAIFTLPQAGYMDDVGLRFPLAYRDLVEKNSVRAKLDPALTFAIARRESSFMADANSSVGALGLMQIMPSTAKYIARKKVSRRSLFNPGVNIRYGTDYLKYLLRETEGNEVIATAAYNAGIYRVEKWVKKSEALPADIWIETIPFHETREYVKSVLAYRQIYSTLLGSDNNQFKELVDLKIGGQG